eukprot:3108083-Prymnesium_polylepis.1
MKAERMRLREFFANKDPNRKLPPGASSPWRERTVEENLAMFARMKQARRGRAASAATHTHTYRARARTQRPER